MRKISVIVEMFNLSFRVFVCVPFVQRSLHFFSQRFLFLFLVFVLLLLLVDSQVWSTIDLSLEYNNIYKMGYLLAIYRLFY
jgi:hypothetical protein